MDARSWARLERLAAQCAAALRDPQRQSDRIWRGDMWAVISAHHDIKKAREKRAVSKSGEAQVGVSGSVSRSEEPQR